VQRVALVVRPQKIPEIGRLRPQFEHEASTHGADFNPYRFVIRNRLAFDA
jgi:hypothetical protein